MNFAIWRKKTSLFVRTFKANTIEEMTPNNDINIELLDEAIAKGIVTTSQLLADPLDILIAEENIKESKQ